MSNAPMTLEEARGYLARAVLTKGPDFTYRPDASEYTDQEDNPCSYFCRTDLPEDDPRHGTPCLIGVALRLAGREITQDMEGEVPDQSNMRKAWNLSERAGSYFREAQAVQDNYRTWGEAYRAAEALVVEWEKEDRLAQEPFTVLTIPPEMADVSRAEDLSGS